MDDPDKKVDNRDKLEAEWKNSRKDWIINCKI